MKSMYRYVIYFTIIGVIFFVNSLFFTHHPPEVQLAFISPGLFILGYSVFRDRFYVKSKMRLIKGK